MSVLALGEAAAVALGVAYLLLAVRQNILCWHAAFLSTAISVWLFWNVSLLMESGLNVYYMAMAVYGWHQWKFGAPTETLYAYRGGAPRPMSPLLPSYSS